MSNATASPRGNALRSALVLLAALLVGVGGWLGLHAFWRHQEIYPATDDALLKAHVLLVRPKVAGPVIAVPVVENQFVRAGDPLFQIDPRPFQQAVDQAQAALTITKADVAADRSTLDTLASAVEVARHRIAAATAQAEYQESLWKDVQTLTQAGEATPKEFAQRKADRDVAQADLATAQASLVEATATLEAAKSRIGDPAYEQARIAKAEAALELARVDLEYTTVRAPADGWITQFDLRVGQVVAPTNTIFYFIEERPWWIEANFKETQMARIQPGQPATFTVDMYPGRTFTGTVESISRGAAAAFTLLPPENTTGNWVKVTQRVPVRIRVEDSDPATPFRKGTSVEVTIDTTRRGDGAGGEGAAGSRPRSTGVRSARTAAPPAAAGSSSPNADAPSGAAAGSP